MKTSDPLPPLAHREVQMPWAHVGAEKRLCREEPPPPTSGAVRSCVGVFAGTAVERRLLGNEAFTMDTRVVLALVLCCVR